MKTSTSLPGARISRRAARKRHRAPHSIAALPCCIVLVAVALTAGCSNNGDTTNAASAGSATAATTEEYACPNSTHY